MIKCLDFWSNYPNKLHKKYKENGEENMDINIDSSPMSKFKNIPW